MRQAGHAQPIVDAWEATNRVELIAAGILDIVDYRRLDHGLQAAAATVECS
jgi:hypothetical protein